MACGDARQRIALPDGTELDVGAVADGESLRREGAELVGFDAGDGLRWLGAWSGATAYVPGDAVSSAGSSYVCVLGHTNQAPPNATYWALLASKGDTGPAGTDGTDGVDGADGADGAGYGGTSATSLAIGTGTKSLTTQAGLAYVVGARVRIVASSDVTKWMEGAVTAYNGGTGAMDVSVDLTSGAGTIASWNLAIAGERGAAGADGADGADGSDIIVGKGAGDVAVGPSSAAETDLVSHSTTLASGDRLRGRAWGVVANTSGSNQTVTFRLKFGSTTLVELVTPNLASGSSRHFELWWDLAAASTSAQRGRLAIWVSQSDASVGTGGTLLGAGDKRAHGTAAEDSTSAKSLKVTAQLSASNANLSLTQRAFELEMV